MMIIYNNMCKYNKNYGNFPNDIKNIKVHSYS